VNAESRFARNLRSRRRRPLKASDYDFESKRSDDPQDDLFLRFLPMRICDGAVESVDSSLSHQRQHMSNYVTTSEVCTFFMLAFILRFLVDYFVI